LLTIPNTLGVVGTVMEDRLKLRYYEVDSISIIDHRVRFIKSKLSSSAIHQG